MLAEVAQSPAYPVVLASAYGISPGQVDSNKLQNLLTHTDIKGKVILFEDGEYIFSSTVSLCSDVVLLGSANTVFSLDPNSPSSVLLNIQNVDNVTLQRISIKGECSAMPTEQGAKCGIWIEAARSVNIENVDVYGWSRYGIYSKTMSSYGSAQDGKLYKQLQILNCRFYNNYCGTYFDYRCEYSQVLNCVFGENYIGSVNCGGNNMYVSCMWNANYYGFVLENSGSNPAHGGCNSSTFNHNVSHAILVKDCVNGWTFDGCQIFYGKVELKNSKGVIFNAAILGSCTVISTGTQKRANLMTDSYFLTDSTAMLKANDGSLYVSNCLPDHIQTETEQEPADTRILSTVADADAARLALSTNAYAGALGHAIAAGQHVDYVDFEVAGSATDATVISGINIWVVNCRTGEVTEQIVADGEKQVTYASDLGTYVIRYELDTAYAYDACFVVQATRTSGINLAYYRSTDPAVKGYLVGDTAPALSDIITLNSDVIPVYHVYQRAE